MLTKTKELEIKYNQNKRPDQERHVLHPFRFFCVYCLDEWACKWCEDYNHNICFNCMAYLVDNTQIFIKMTGQKPQ
jgi:hypothetical protein